MTGQDRDLLLAEWISEGHDQGSPEALERALSATRAVRQRPGWAFWRNWLPRPVANLEMWMPRPSVGILLLVAMLVLLALMAVYVGSAPRAPRLPSSIGPAAHRLIAFSEQGAITVAQLDGSNRRVLSGEASDARHPVFSPDGTQLAFLSSLSPTGFGRLFVVPVDGSGPAIDVSDGLDVLAGDVPQFSWSPDSRSIAFAADNDGVATIHVAAADGSGVAPLTDGTSDSDLPSWSLDGVWIAYRVAEADGQRRRLETTRPDGTETLEVATVIAPDGSLSRLLWSSRDSGTGDDDGIVSYWQGAGFGTPPAATVDLRAGHYDQPWMDGVGGFVDFGAPFAPDGLLLAMLTAEDGLVVADVDENGPPFERETRHLGPIADCWVDWSPDGTSLFGGSPGGCDRLVVTPLDDPGAAITLPWSISGTADWQPLPE